MKKLILLILLLASTICFSQVKEIDTLYSERGEYYNLDIIKRVRFYDITYEPVLESGHWDLNNNCMVYSTFKTIAEPVYNIDTVITIRPYDLIKTLNYILKELEILRLLNIIDTTPPVPIYNESFIKNNK